MSVERSPCLYVCTACTGNFKAGVRSAADYDAAGELRPGKALYQTLKAQAANDPDNLIDIQAVVCLGNCEQGCSAAIAEPGKWGYLLGDLQPAMADDLFTYGQAYAKSKSGTVMRSGRPDSLRHAIMSRFPVPGNASDGADDTFLERTVSSRS